MATMRIIADIWTIEYSRIRCFAIGILVVIVKGHQILDEKIFEVPIVGFDLKKST